jgi:hypothetical protein
MANFNLKSITKTNWNTFRLNYQVDSESGLKDYMFELPADGYDKYQKQSYAYAAKNIKADGKLFNLAKKMDIGKSEDRNKPAMNAGETDWTKKFLARPDVREVDIASNEYMHFNVFDVHGDLDIEQQFGKIPVRLGRIYGNFDCSHIGLETLENGPIEVDGNYICAGNNLRDLKGIAEQIGGDFDGRLQSSRIELDRYEVKRRSMVKGKILV